MTQLQGEITVLQHEITTLRGLRLSDETAVAEAAIRRERKLEKELREIERLEAAQGELPGLALAASAQPKE